MAQQSIAERFIAALGQLEGARDVEPLVTLHGEDCDVGNVNVPERFHGPDGARRFWSEYRDTFGEVRSEFRNVIATADRVALEWTTTGTSVDDKPLTYDGVSILEVDGDKLTRFRAYFDPGKLGRQMTQ
jgi:ketosteroid isomerase-like protein